MRPSANGTRRIAMPRRSFIRAMARLGCVIPTVPSMPRAQGTFIWHIGLALGDDPEGGAAAFRQKLRELGYTEGRNPVIENRDVLRAHPRDECVSRLGS